MKYSINKYGCLTINGERSHCAFINDQLCGLPCAAFEVFEVTRYTGGGDVIGTRVTLHCVKREIFIPRESEK